MTTNVTMDDVVAKLGNMSVLEVIALTKELEEKWGVKAEPQLSAPVPTVGPVLTDPAVQAEFTVMLVSYPPDKKMSVIKLVKELMGLGLKEAKDFAESAPKPVKEGVSKDEAADLKAKLEAAGAVVEIR